MLKKRVWKEEIFSTPAFLRAWETEISASSGVAIAHRRTASAISTSSYEARPAGADAPAICPNSGEAVVPRRTAPKIKSPVKRYRSSEVFNIFSFTIYFIRL